jgi:hypothetical protein
VKADGIGSCCGLGFAGERQGALAVELHQGQGNEIGSIGHGIHPAEPHKPATLPNPRTQER